MSGRLTLFRYPLLHPRTNSKQASQVLCKMDDDVAQTQGAHVKI